MTTREDDERPDADSKERLPLGELRPDDRGQDEVREDLEESIGRGEAAALDPRRTRGRGARSRSGEDGLRPSVRTRPQAAAARGRKTDRPAQG